MLNKYFLGYFYTKKVQNAEDVMNYRETDFGFHAFTWIKEVDLVPIMIVSKQDRVAYYLQFENEQHQMMFILKFGNIKSERNWYTSLSKMLDENEESNSRPWDENID